MSANESDVASAIADARSFSMGSQARESSPVMDAISDARASVAPPPAPQGPGAATSAGMGLSDTPVGLGQIAEHALEGPLNKFRKVQQYFYEKGAGVKGDVPGRFPQVSAADYDRMVQERENLYQRQREDAGQNGIDWWRVGGNVADPINFVGPAAAETAAGRIAVATGTGAAFGAASPSDHPGDFWADKAKGAAVGAATGAVVGGVTEGVTKAIGAGVRYIRGQGDVSKEATDAVTDAIAKGAAQNQGIDPKSLDPDVLKAMRQEAQEALNKGVAPSQDAIFNRTLANSLPVPVPLTRGQATRDPLQFAKEFSLKQVEGVGEPLAYNEQAQNRALIENLNVMGAKNAPDVVSAGQTLVDHLKTGDKALTDKIGAAYDAVRNSSGQPASMDGKVFAESILSQLESRDLPESVQATIREIADGKLPLNVTTAQYLDKSWSGLQSGKGGYGVSTTADRAIQIAKAKLLAAPVVDAAGDESIAAYKVAKQLAKARFDLLDANPGYKAVVSEARDAEPDKFFRKYVMGATAREAAGLRGLVTKVDPNADKLIGTTLLGEIKNGSINGTEENGAFSQAKFSKFLDPVWQARLKALLPEGLTQSLTNLNRVAELVQRAPVASVPNRSGTAATAGNMLVSAMKAGAGEKVASTLSRVPGISAAFETAGKLSAVSRAQKGVQEALNPGVTSKALPGVGPVSRQAMRLATMATVPAASQEETRGAK